MLWRSRRRRPPHRFSAQSGSCQGEGCRSSELLWKFHEGHSADGEAVKIYVASSWRNNRQAAVVAALRDAGHEVYDFKNPREGDRGFSWKQILDKKPQEWTPRQYRDQVLTHPRARKGFESDMTALASCDACVLVLPCGRSAHMELGFATGESKQTIILLDDHIDEPELMYLMNSSIALDIAEVVDMLKPGDMMKRGEIK